MLQRGCQLHTLTQEQIYFVGSYVHIIALLERHFARCGTDKTYCIARHKDIGIGRLTTTVNDNIIYSVTENQQRTLSRQHLNGYTRLLSNLVTPDTCGINHNLRTILGSLTRTAIEHLDTHDALLLTQEIQHLVVGQHLGTIHLSVNKVCRSQTERINSSIGNTHSTNHSRVSRRLQQECLLRVNSIGTNARSTARLDKLSLKLQAILGEADKQTIGLLNAVARNAAQNHILLDTLLG